MEPGTPDRARRWWAAATLAALLSPAAPARGQEAEGPAVRASVTGELTRGRQARFEVNATHPEGWRAISHVLTVLELHGAPLEEVDYDVAGSVLAVGSTRAVVGTGNAVAGRFLRIGAFGVAVSTTGNRLELSFGARILQDMPPGARIRFTAEDDEGRAASVTVRPAVVDEDGGLSLGTVVLAALGALLAGGYLGARVASHRRRPSIYEAVARRVAEERGAPGGPRRH
jgi:hypothetical protein